MRPIRTVVAKPLDDKAQADIQAGQRSDEDQVLAALLDNPGSSIANLAQQLAWFYSTGKPAKSRAQRVLERLEKDRLIILQRGGWELTDKGKRVAEKLPGGRTKGRTDAGTTEAPKYEKQEPL